jgi:MFS family permease
MAIALTRNFWLWFPLRFALGVVINVMFVISETWINGLAPSSHRGRIMGLYATIAAVGFAAGPVLLSAIGTEGALPFAIAIVAPLAAMPVLLAARTSLPDGFDDEQGGSIVTFARAAPVLLAAVGAAALYDQTALVLFPVYGLAVGLDEAATNIALSVTVLGNVALQVPLGYLAERMDRRTILLVLAVLSAIGFASLPAFIGTPAGWPLLFAIGACGFGGFTVVMVELGERFTGSMLLAGNAAFSMAWGLGGLVGPPISGGVMERIGPNGFPITLAVMFAALAAVLLALPLVRHAKVRAA